MKKLTIKDRFGGLPIASRESREQKTTIAWEDIEDHYKKIVDMINERKRIQEFERKLENFIDQITNQIKILDAYQEIIIKTYLRKIASIDNRGN